MSYLSDPFDMTLLATSAALLSSPTTAFATDQLFIIDSQESALLAYPTSCYAKDESSSGKWANAPQQWQEQFDDRCYPGPCSPLTTTATAHEEDHGRGASPSQTSFWTLSAIQSGLLPTGPQSSSRLSTISTPYPPAQALMGSNSNLSGESSLRSSPPPPELASEKALGFLTYPDGAKERGVGSPITKISVPLMPKKDHPIAATEINASASDTRSPSLVPSPLDSSHPSVHCQYIQTSFTPLQQPRHSGRPRDLAQGPHSPIQAPFELVGHNNKLGHIYFRKSPEIDYKTKANNGDSHLDEPCGTLSDDAVISAIQQYLRTFPDGEKGPSGLEYEAQEETSQSRVAHPGTEAQKHLEMNLILEDLERTLQEHSTAKTESATTLDQKFDTISSPGKVDRDIDVKCIETEGETTASRPPQHKSPPYKAPCVEQEHTWPSFTAKRYQDRHIAVSQTACLRLPERRGKAPRLGPDLRLRSLSEQLSLEQESDKKCPSFQDARNLIDDWDKVVRDKEALLRKRIRSRAFRSEKHKWDLSRKLSSNIAYARPAVGDLCLMKMNGQRAQPILTGKVKDFGGSAIRIRKRNERTSRSSEQKGGYPNATSNVVLIRKQVEGGAAHTGGDGETTSTSGSALHKRKRDEEELVRSEHKGKLSSIDDIVIYKRKRIGEEPAPSDLNETYSGTGDNAICDKAEMKKDPPGQAKKENTLVKITTSVEMFEGNDSVAKTSPSRWQPVSRHDPR